MTPEFSRRFVFDTIGTAARQVSIEADSGECKTLAARFNLISLDALSATTTLRASARGIEANGKLSAWLVQACVVTGDPVPTQIDEGFTLRFVEPQPVGDAAEEIELSDSDCDIVEIDGGAVDLGEAVAQTLGLALDPFPRCEDERAREDERKWVAGDEAGPFAGLKGLLGN